MGIISADDAVQSAFNAARLSGLAKINEARPNNAGIGTLAERSLHCILKYWAQPDDSHHEISLGLGKLVADVFDGERVTEIQTRGFSPLKDKLSRILPHYPVTVIHPVTVVKRLIWIDPESGESTSPRKSPKHGNVWEVFSELTRISQFLNHPGLQIKIVMLDMDEFRLKNGWGKGRKRGSHRVERIPTAIREVITFESCEDYFELLSPPENPLPDIPFTVAQVAKLHGIGARTAGAVVYSMYHAGIIIRTGKIGNAWQYAPAAEV